MIIPVQSFAESQEFTTHFPYKGLCAPGFVALGKICVLDDRCGPGAYPGKICEIDGKVKPYLKPLQQGGAGIAAGDVICAEGLELVFRSSNGAPSCVRPESVFKLQERGWKSEKPVFACTLQYDPVCGMDGKTYGNSCAINHEHVMIKHEGECKVQVEESSGIFEESWSYTEQPVTIGEKGYFVAEIADGIYWLASSGYQTIFLTTGQGVIVVDAPQPIGQKYLDAISEVTDEPITHMIYSHHHQDHTGAAGQIFAPNITYIAQQKTAELLMQENDTNRPIPTITFDDKYTLEIGNQTLELIDIGGYHSDGDTLILAPKQKVAMVVDLMRPGITPYRAFAVTPDIEQYIMTHDMLVDDYDFDVLVSGHTQILATKEHIATNKEFTLDVMENAKISLEESDPVQPCVKLTTSQWKGRLDNLGEFMAEHCTAMIDYVSQ